ncbi:MAG: amidohydrolase, partial [Pseudonocardiales bacterium]|nr:amidohydrolase [Pseudonocardiales bacterium]
VLQAVPGCYLMLGAAPDGNHVGAPSNHSPRAVFSDAVLAQGALLHAQLAVRSLARDAMSALPDPA